MLKLSFPMPVAFSGPIDPVAPSVAYTRTEAAGRGTNHALRMGERRSSVFTPTTLTGSEKLGSVTRILDAVVASAFTTIQGRNSDGYTGQALASIVNVEVAKIRPAFENFVAATKSIRSNHAVRRARVVQHDLNIEPNSQLRSDLRRWFFDHDVATRQILLLDANFDLCVAIYEIGAKVAGVSDGIWKQFENRWIMLNHIRRTGLESAYGLQSTPDNVTAAGIDQAALMAAAQLAVDGLEQESELLELAENYAKAVLQTVVLLTGQGPDQFLNFGA